MPPADDCWPGTDVLVDKLGLRDADRLGEAESRLVFLRDIEVRRNPVHGPTSLARLRAIHRHLFQDLYDWAGELRTVDIAKDGTTFCLARFVPSAADGIVGDEERATALGSPDDPVWVPAIASLLADVNPATDLAALLDAAEGTPVGAVLTALTAVSWSEAYDDVDLEAVVRRGARTLVRDIAGRCVVAPETLVSLVEAEARCAAGDAVTYRRFAGVDHLPIVLPGSALDAPLLEWTEARLAGDPPPTTCATIDA